MGRVLIYALGGGRGHATRAGVLVQALVAAGHDASALVREGSETWVPEGRGIAVPRQGRDDLGAHVAQVIDGQRPDALLVDVFPSGLLDELMPSDGGVFGVRAALMLRLHQEVESPSFKDAAAAYALRVDLEPSLHWLPDDVDALPLGPVARRLPAPEEAPRILLVPAGDDALAEQLNGSIDALLAYDAELHWIAPHEAHALTLGPGDVVVGRAGYNLSWEIAGAGARHVALPAARRWDDQRRRAEAMATVVTTPAEMVAAVGRALAAGPRPPVDVDGAGRIVRAIERGLLG